MTKPSAKPILTAEAARVAELRAYHILDTAPDARLDELTSLASQICGTPIALISLIDESRQWFLSNQGLAATETARDVAFCAHAIKDQQQMLVVGDAKLDDRFATNPLVMGDPNIRFYAGVPLVTPAGHALGTLCAIDSVPRTLNASQISALQILARQVMQHLESRRQIRAMSEQRVPTEAEQTTFLRKIKFGFAIAVLLLFGVGAGVAWNERAQSAAADAVTHTIAVIKDLRDILDHTTAAETGLRGFLLSQEERFLQPYEQALPLINVSRDSLRARVQDHPEQLARAATLYQLTSDRILVLKDALARQSLGLPPSPANLERGRILMERVIALVGEMRDVEESLLKQRKQTAATSEAVTKILFALGLLVALAIIVWLFILVLAEHKKRRASELELERAGGLRRTILESMQQSVIAVTPDGKITSFNHAAEQMLGYRADEMLGRAAFNEFHDSQEIIDRAGELSVELGRTVEPGLDVFIAPLREGHQEKRDWTYVRKDGSRFPVTLSISALHDNSGIVTGYVAIAADISERVRTLEALRQAKEEAELGARTKSAFLATMSHEIRTPMNGVIGMTSLLLDTELNAEQREFTEVIRVSGESLLVVINDILDYSKIESGKMDLERHPFDLEEGVEGTIELLAPLAQEKQLDVLYLIDADVPKWVMGDLPRLRQVLVNLISNAIKFTSEGEILVTVSRTLPMSGNPPALAVHEPCELEFCIRDSGIGIPSDKLSLLFSPFTQVDSSTSRRFGGTGLGLAISKRLVEAMGGTIRVDSRAATAERSGETRFRFTYPTAVAPGLPSSHAANPSAIRGRHLLVVDDSETNLKILSAQAQRWGLRATTASTPDDALRHIESGQRFDLVITDMQMPGMSGVNFTRRLRVLSPSMPAILLSSVSMRHSRDAALFVATLLKPVRQSALLDAVMHAFHADQHLPALQSTKATQFDTSLATRHPRRILVAEDNEVNQKLALRMLKAFGYQADIAANGLEAVAAVTRQRYDIVFMDIQMPEMDGFEAMREIRRTLAPAQVPDIIGLSANAMREDADLAIASGMDDYLTKPVAAASLRDALERWGQRTRSDLENRGSIEVASSAPPVQHTQTAARPSDEPGSDAEALLEGLLDELQLQSIRDIDEDGTFVREVVTSFNKRAPTLILQLEQAALKHDLKAIGILGHELRGMSGMLGARLLAEKCIALEASAKANSLGELNQRADDLKVVATATISALNRRTV